MNDKQKLADVELMLDYGTKNITEWILNKSYLAGQLVMMPDGQVVVVQSNWFRWINP